jgi:hypothetical protein
MHSRIELVDVELTHSTIYRHEEEIVELFKNNWFVQEHFGIHTIEHYIVIYLERNRAIAWPNVRKNLLDVSFV